MTKLLASILALGFCAAPALADDAKKDACTGARFVPHVQDGKTNGFKMYAIRPGSSFAKGGLQNGDLVTAVDGREIAAEANNAEEIATKLCAPGTHEADALRKGTEKVHAKVENQ
ncbi:hypothetical protein BH11MYX2_BH11MYX2_20900 [soil metagenome]